MPGSGRAQQAYALAYRAVAEMAALDTARGLSLFFEEWRRSRRLDAAVRSAYGMTLAGFEERWQRRTRWRYGGVALVADLTLASGVVLLVVFPLYVIRKRRDRLRMAQLVAADQAFERQIRESGLDALLADDPPPAARQVPGSGAAGPGSRAS